MIEKGAYIFPLVGQSENLINNIKNILSPINKKPCGQTQKGLSCRGPITCWRKKTNLLVWACKGEGLSYFCDYLPTQDTHRVKLNLESLNSRRLNIQSLFGVMNVGGTFFFFFCQVPFVLTKPLSRCSGSDMVLAFTKRGVKKKALPIKS